MAADKVGVAKDKAADGVTFVKDKATNLKDKAADGVTFAKGKASDLKDKAFDLNDKAAGLSPTTKLIALLIVIVGASLAVSMHKSAPEQFHISTHESQPMNLMRRFANIRTYFTQNVGLAEEGNDGRAKVQSVYKTAKDKASALQHTAAGSLSSAQEGIIAMKDNAVDSVMSTKDKAYEMMDDATEYAADHLPVVMCMTFQCGPFRL